MMRHRIFIRLMKGAALLAVTLAAACTKEERVEHGIIDFSDPKVVKTKSSTLIDDVSMESFRVFATMSYDDDAELFMDNVKVYKSNDEWTYDADLNTDGIQSSYWFHGAEHEFYAVYPSDDPNLVYSYENGKVKVTGTLSTDGTTYNPIFTGTNISTKSSTAPDILCGYFSSDAPKTVSIDMKHAFASVSFKIINDSDIDIKSVLPKQGFDEIAITGTYTGDIYNGLSNAADKLYVTEDGSVWENLKYDENHSFILPNLEGLSDNAGKTIHSTDYWYTALVLPQSLDGKEMSLSFSVTFTSGESKDYTLNLEDYVVGDGNTYKSGSHYVYTVNISGPTVDVQTQQFELDGKVQFLWLLETDKHYIIQFIDDDDDHYWEIDESGQLKKGKNESIIFDANFVFTYEFIKEDIDFQSYFSRSIGVWKLYGTDLYLTENFTLGPKEDALSVVSVNMYKENDYDLADVGVTMFKYQGGSRLFWDDINRTFTFKTQEEHNKGPMDREWYIYEAIPVEQQSGM